MVMTDYIAGGAVVLLVLLAIAMPIALFFSWVKERYLRKKIPQDVREKIINKREVKQNAVQEKGNSEGGRETSGGRSFKEERSPRRNEGAVVDSSSKRILQPTRSVQPTDPGVSAEHKQKLKLHKPSDL